MVNESDIGTVAVYTRVSTDEQAKEGYSLDSQLDKLRSYCKARDWKIIGEYVDDGKTGRNTNRPGYQQMLADIDQWDAILVIKGDRIHRNSKNHTEMMQTLGKLDKHYVSMSENYDTSTAGGRLIMDFIMRLGQYESEIIGERVFSGQLQKAKEKKKFMGHRVPFGYNWDAEKKEFIPIKKELDLVKQVFQMYIDGFSMRSIGKKVGKSNTTVKYFLHNCFYAGLERWCNQFRKILDLEPLITVDTFNQVQNLMRDRCHSHCQYEPMLIQDKDFKLDAETVKHIPVINRAKHNFNFQEML